MAIPREDPYGAFNYQVTISPDAGNEVQGGFSDVSGLGTEISYADYRVGTEDRNRVRKIPLTYSASEVTLKRGLIAALDLWEWTELVRTGDMTARAKVVIQHKAEDNEAVVATYVLEGARPSKWTGPTLAAKAGGDVAMEELTLVCEDIKFE